MGVIMARRTYHVLDGLDEDTTPSTDLRAGNFLRSPLTRKVKALATLIGALVAIGGYVIGAGRYAIKWGGIATTADLAAQAATAEEHRQADNKVDASRVEAMNKRLDALDKKLDEIAAEVQGRGKRRKPRSPVGDHAGGSSE